MNSVDTHYFQLGLQNLCGVDEAGRGPWAGPVTVAAVVLPRNHGIGGLDDSKKLSAEKREQLFTKITEVAIAYNIISISSTQIDRSDILSATKRGMQQAVKGLTIAPDLILLDAVNIQLPEIVQISLLKGDSRSEHIAAASILAKVTRDQFMLKMDHKYPQYGFAEHKGYGTKKHLEALQKWGPCPIHRMSFAPVREVMKQKSN